MSDNPTKRKDAPEADAAGPSNTTDQSKKPKLEDGDAAATSPLANRDSESSGRGRGRGRGRGGKGKHARGGGYKGKKPEKSRWHKNDENKDAKSERQEQQKSGEGDNEAGEKEKRLPKRKVALAVGYCGTGMSGSQINPGVKTVEGEIFKILVDAGCVSADNAEDHTKVNLLRAARTDAGVHAAVNMLSAKLILNPPAMAAESTIEDYLNALLPEHLRIWSITRVQSSFNPRTFCDSRMYDYLLPTYVFLPPRPGTCMYRNLKSSWEKEGKDTSGFDVEFWDKFFEEHKELSRDSHTVVSNDTPQADKTEQQLQEDRDRQSEAFKTEMLAKRTYRITPDVLETIRNTVKAYLGTHNFHNFTIAKDFKDRSAQRTMKQITVSEPFLVGECEWISVKIHGQSFMLHQIRKMIGLIILVVRSQTPASLIPELFGPAKIHIPKAPALGLLLEQPLFGTYNNKVNDSNTKLDNLIKDGRMTETQAEESGQRKSRVEFDEDTKTRIEDFKKKFIYEKMWEDEAANHTFAKFLNLLDVFPGQDFAFLNPSGVVPQEAVTAFGSGTSQMSKKERNVAVTGVEGGKVLNEQEVKKELESDDEDERMEGADDG